MVKSCKKRIDVVCVYEVKEFTFCPYSLFWFWVDEGIRNNAKLPKPGKGGPAQVFPKSPSPVSLRPFWIILGLILLFIMIAIVLH